MARNQHGVVHRLGHRRKLHRLCENLAARAYVIEHVPLETVDIVKSAPDVLVHLHHPDVAGGGFEISDAIADHHELPPTAFLPRSAQDQVDIEAAVVSLEGGHAGY